MAIIIDKREETTKGVESKSAPEVFANLAEADVMAFERKLQEDLIKRLKWFVDKHPELKNVKIV